MNKKHSDKFIRLVDDAFTRIPEISAEEIRDRLAAAEDFELIDTRETHEYEEGHIPKAKHLSKGVIERDIEKEVADSDKEIVLYCGGGYRSALAADNLKKMGYSNVKSMAGGWRGWKKSGFKTEIS